MTVLQKIDIAFHNWYRQFRRDNEWYCRMRQAIRVWFWGHFTKDGNRWLRSVGDEYDR